MRKVLVIFMFTIYAFSTTELIQLLKLPIFISHFIEHKDNDKMNMVEFIVHHYGGHEKDADWETDMRLPFMKPADLLNVVSIPQPLQEFSISRNNIAFNADYIDAYPEQHLPKSMAQSIWQPPRV